MNIEETGWWWNKKSDQLTPAEILVSINNAINETRRLYLDDYRRKKVDKTEVSAGYGEALYSTCMCLMEALEFAQDAAKIHHDAEFICLVDFNKREYGEKATVDGMSQAEKDRAEALTKKMDGGTQ